MYYETMDRFKNASVEELTSIPDIGEIIAKSIKDYFENDHNNAIVEELKNIGVNMEYTGPKVEVDEAIENGSRLSTVKLTAHTACNFIVDHRKLAWRVTTVTGEQYLIGTTEQPFPITTVANDFPDKETERSGQIITVTWKTPLTLLKIID